MFIDRGTISSACALAGVTKETIKTWEEDGLTEKTIHGLLNIANIMNIKNHVPVMSKDDPELYKLAATFVRDTDVDRAEKNLKKIRMCQDGTKQYILIEDLTRKDEVSKFIKVYSTGNVCRALTGEPVTYTENNNYYYKLNLSKGNKIELSRLVCWAFARLDEETKLMSIYHTHGSDIYYSNSILNLEVCTVQQYQRYTDLEKRLKALYGERCLVAVDPDLEDLKMYEGISRDTVDRLEKLVNTESI